MKIFGNFRKIRMFQILVGKESLLFRNLPVYSESRIRQIHAAFRFGMVIIVTFVLEYGSIRQN